MKEKERPSWIDIFINMAFVIAERSHDEETQVGCILTNTRNHVLSTGINGYPAQIQDDDLPKTRPGKYDMKIIHAEENAMLSCPHKELNMRAYLTCAPCYSCFTRMYQFGIREIYYTTLYLPKSADPNADEMRRDFIRRTNYKLFLYKVPFKDSFLENLVKKVKNLQQNA